MQSQRQFHRDIIQTPGYITPPTSPVHLTAFTTLSSNSASGVNAIALKNPMARPMEILEVKWQLVSPVSDQDVGRVLGGIVACKLDLGKYPLTNGFVPIWSFSRTDNLSQEALSDGFTGQSFCEYTWSLPKPLYVPSGAVVIPTFQHRGLLQSDIFVRVSYSGRTLIADAPMPRKIRLPYASAWASKVFDSDEPDTDNSLETDLVNPFNEVLHLQRFTGRCQSQRSSDGLTTETFFETIPSQTMNVRMTDSYGRPIIRDFTPFRQAFSSVTRSWEMERGQVMDPNSYYQFFVRKDVPLQGSGEFVILSQLFVGLAGWREVVGEDV